MGIRLIILAIIEVELTIHDFKKWPFQRSTLLWHNSIKKGLGRAVKEKKEKKKLWWDLPIFFQIKRKKVYIDGFIYQISQGKMKKKISYKWEKTFGVTTHTYYEFIYIYI